MRAATVVVVTAGGPLQRAASPGKAKFAIIVDAAAGGAIRARVVVVAHARWLGGGGRRWARVGWVGALLYRVGGLQSNATLARCCIDVALHSDVTTLTPRFAP